VPKRLWGVTRARAGKTVYLRAVPQGGNGKNPLASILMVVVAVAAIATGQVYGLALAQAVGGAGIAAGSAAAAVGSAVIAAGVSLVGAMIVSALFPPPRSDSGTTTARYQITGTQNQLQPYAYIPRVFGRRRLYPMLAAHSYSENQGNDQYIRMLLCVGYGPLKIEDIRIGDTPIGVFANVQIETREGWLSDAPVTLYTTDINEQHLQIEMHSTNVNDGNADYVSRFTEINTSEIIVDVSCLAGLAHFKSDGGREAQSVQASVQYRQAGTSSWLTPAWTNSGDDGLGTNGLITIKDLSTSTAVRSGHFKTPFASQWEVRVRRNQAERDPAHDADTIYWTALRSIKYQAPVTQKGLALIALRIKATEQLNGVPDAVNCLASSYLPTWSSNSAPGQYTWQVSQNPAWAYLLAMLYRGLDDPLIPPTRIDHPALLSWAQACDAAAINDPGRPRWTFNAVFEGGSVFTALQQIANSCRASFSMRDGKYSVFVDLPQTVPVQHITPRNSSNYSGNKAWADLPHALRITINNEDKNFADDEVLVFDDGYDQSNATKYETLPMSGCTRSAQAWREGRYFIAAAKLRPETHTVTMDIENLRCTLGDFVRFSYDVVSIGLNTGRIKARLWDASGNIKGYQLDGPVQMDGGRSYAMRVRMVDGSSTTLSLVTYVGVSDTVTLISPISAGLAPDGDDLYMYGEASRESAPMIIKSIKPSSNLTATVTMVDAQPGVWTADSQAIPAFDDYVTQQTPFQQQGPQPPVISTILSDETVIERLSDGTLQDRILVTLAPQSGGFVPAAGFETQYRISGAVKWTDGPNTTPADPNCYIAPVLELGFYDLRVRAVSKYGVPSTWTQVNAYQVIGKTSKPQDVTGFAATANAAGAQLTWNQNPDIDLAGYTLKSGGNWDTATLLSQVMSGTSYFLQFTDALPKTVLIKAVDVLGNESVNAAVLTTQAVAPEDVTDFQVYPQSDSFMFKWVKIADAGYEYEIRCGDAWALGQVVGRFAGDTATVKWPVSTADHVTFWIKALSQAGLYSADARYATIYAEPLPSRNMVFTRDFVGASFPGVKLDMTLDGEFLDLSKNVSGSNQPAGDYYEEIVLSNSFYARNWMTLRANSVSQAGLSWDAATFAWDSPDDPTWQGVLGDADGAQVKAYIATAQALDSSVVEGWRLNGSLAGTKGTAPVEQVGISYAPAWFSNGLDVTAKTRASWAVAVPATFSLTFDFRPDQVNTSDDSALVKLAGPAYSLLLFFDRLSGTFALVDPLGQRLEIALPLELGDNLVFAISQSSSQRSLFGATRRYPTPVAAQAPFAPLGTFSTLALHA
jgi:predicted phage tail protein